MKDPVVEKLVAKVDEYRDYAVKLLVELIKRQAVNPSYGGEGEYDKAMFILDEIKNWGFSDVKVINAPDPRAKGGIRPNIVAFIRGEVNEKLWILTHLDVVPPGDLAAWTVTKPFEPVVKDGKVYGRGSEDNGQAMVSSLIAAKALLDLGVKPRRTIAIAMVSDEEAGSEYGVKYLARNHSDMFDKRDVALVPDAGASDGGFIEVAEKSILWARLRIRGLQVHASIPHKGLNPHRVAAEYLTLLDRLIREKYGRVDPLFEPPFTTCEPTMVKNPSTSPNIIPGEHEVVVDCRVLPGYSLDDLLNDMRKIMESLKAVHGKEIGGKALPELEIEILGRSDAAPPTPLDSPIVKTLTEALKSLRGIEPRIGGIGGGTVAAYFRRMGIHAAVWSTIDETAHSPNEYAVIENMVNDAKVMAYLMVKT